MNYKVTIGSFISYINVVSVEMMVRKNKKLTKNTTHTHITHTHTYTNRTGHHVCIKNPQ